MQKNTKNSIADRKWRTMRVIKSDITQNSTGYQGDYRISLCNMGYAGILSRKDE